MNLEDRLQRLQRDVRPSDAAKARIFERIQRKIDAPEVLRLAAKVVVPEAELSMRVWQRVSAVVSQSPVAFLERVRRSLRPSLERSAQLWQLVILPQLAPQTVAPRSYRSLAWVTAVAVIAVAVRISPALFLAPPIQAEHHVTVLSTRGTVLVMENGAWVPVTGERILGAGMQIRTEDSEASILLQDDGVVRLDEATTVTLLDASDRLEPAPDVLPTLALESGRIWIQGLVPSTLRGITVAVDGGHVTVHEGSISIKQQELAMVEVHHRSAVVLHDSYETRLIAGERTELWDGNVVQVQSIPTSGLNAPWVAQNISRDAVHRRDTALLQQERRAARAGILPNSTFYPVKRVAERVDVLLTFSEDARLEKQIAHANTRLNEAAALIQEGFVDEVATPLAEYRTSLLAIAGTSEGNSDLEFLLRQAVSEATADTAAAVPGDETYLLKRTVLEALSELPGESLSSEDLQVSMVVDALAAITQAAEAGDLAEIPGTWLEIKPYLALVEEGAVLPEEVAREAQALLQRFAEAMRVEEENAEFAFAPTVLREITALLPVVTAAPSVSALSDEEVALTALAIKDRVFLYRMPRSRKNQLVAELKELQGNSDAGRILRVLYHAMPEATELLTPVRRSITQLKSTVAAGEGAGSN